MPGPHRILFIHIPKTAGESLIAALEAWAGRERTLRFSRGGKAEADAYLAVPEAAFAGLRLVAGHLSFRTFHKRDIRQWKPVTVLREPMALALSHYSFVRRHPTHPWYPQVSGLTFSQYVERDLQAPNMQCHVIAGEKSAGTAYEVLRREFFLASTIENVDHLADALSGHLGVAITMPRLNVAPEPTNTDAIDPRTRARLVALNAEDTELYRRVSADVLVGRGAPTQREPRPIRT